MLNQRFRMLSIMLLCSALVLALLGVYFMMARQNYVVGGLIMFVALSDVGLAMFFSRRANG
jgi:hypothetical protein